MRLLIYWRILVFGVSCAIIIRWCDKSKRYYSTRRAMIGGEYTGFAGACQLKCLYTGGSDEFLWSSEISDVVSVAASILFRTFLQRSNEGRTEMES